MIFAAVGAYIMFSIERPVIRSPRYILGLVMVLAGTAGAILLGDHSVAPAETRMYVEGVGLSLLSGAMFAAYALAVRKYMAGYGSVISFTVISQYTAAAMVGLMLVFGRRGGLEALDLSGRDFALLLVSSVLGIALGIATVVGVVTLGPVVMGCSLFWVAGAATGSVAGLSAW